MSNKIIRVENLCKTYESGKESVEAVKNVSFEIEKGEIFGIIGLSGAGKSTVVRTLNLLERPTSGVVEVNGKNLMELSEKELRCERQNIGMIFQHFNLLMQKTVLKNVMFPMEIAGYSKADARKRAYEVLEIVGLADKAKAYPAQLSGGQKQRVAIARALSTNPEIILSDESTSALDPQTTGQILDLLKKLSTDYGITVVVITHEMSVIQKICDRVVVLDQGTIAESGTVQELFQNPKTDAAKRLVLNGIEHIDELKGDRTIRVTFSENSAFEPVIGNITLEYKTPVNILYANTHEENGRAVGEMILGLPENDEVADGMIKYLKEHGIGVEELTGYVG